MQQFAHFEQEDNKTLKIGNSKSYSTYLVLTEKLKIPQKNQFFENFTFLLNIYKKEKTIKSNFNQIGEKMIKKRFLLIQNNYLAINPSLKNLKKPCLKNIFLPLKAAKNSKVYKNAFFFVNNQNAALMSEKWNPSMVLKKVSLKRKIKH